MDFSFSKVLPDEFVKAFCNTLLHSLWQGLLLAIIVGVMMVSTRNVKSARRYQLLIGLLFIFSCGVVLTFGYEFRKLTGLQLRVVYQYPIVDIDGEPLIENATKVNDANILFGTLNHYSNVIILVWFAMMLIKTFQLLTDLQLIYHLRRRKVFRISEDWENRVNELSSKLGIKRIVAIAESGIARVPMVIGHFKPLILLPLGLATALSPAEIEAILIHELAHVYRRDYLINVLISLLEIVFFFNPAVLWIASLIRDERENCCDDIAVKHTNNKIDYVKALIACQEYHLSAPNYAMAVSGGKKHLSSRVKRLVSNNNTSLNTIEKLLLSACLVLGILLTAAFTNAGKIDHLVVAANEKVAQLSKSVVTEKSRTSDSEVKKIPSALSSLNEHDEVDEPSFLDSTSFKIFRSEQVGNHTSVKIPNGDVETQLLKYNGTLFQVNTQQNRVVSLQVNETTVASNQIPKYIARVDSIQATLRPLATTIKKLNHKINTQQNYQQQNKTYLADSSYSIKPYKSEYNGIKTGLERQISRLSKIEVPIHLKMEKTTDGNDISAKVLRAILNEGMASEVKSYKLTENDLILNGRKISDESFQKFKNKYMKSFTKRTVVYYNYETNTTVTEN